VIEIHKNFETFRSAFQLIASLSKVFVELEFFKFVGRQELELRIEKALENDKWTELEENLDCHLVGDGKSDSCYTGATLFDLTFSDEGTLERAKVIGFMNKLSDNIEVFRH
jgi:hypothetical protein